MLFHIGYHKTGTTWLQVHLFANSSLKLKLVDQELVRSLLITPGSFEFDADVARSQLNEVINRAEDEGLIPVISHEGLSGSAHGGGYNSRELADRIKEIDPQAKILIVIREQRSAILSNYAQYLAIGGQARLEEYVRPEARWQDRIPQFHSRRFHYHHLIGYCRNIFGIDNVQVIPYEQFVSHPEDFAGKVLQWCKAQTSPEQLQSLPYENKENRKSSAAALAVKRTFNFIYPLDTFHHRERTKYSSTVRGLLVDLLARLAGSLCPPQIDKCLRNKSTRWLAAYCAGRFAESNAIIDAWYGLNLNKWGYEVAALSRTAPMSAVCPLLEKS